MADISDVRTSEIKEISDSLEALSCKKFPYADLISWYLTLSKLALQHASYTRAAYLHIFGGT